MKKLTLNQKLNLTIVIVAVASLIVSIIGLIITLNAKQDQIIIKQEIDQIRAKLGEFENLNAANANFGSLNTNCPPGTHSNVVFTDKGIQTTCY